MNVMQTRIFEHAVTAWSNFYTHEVDGFRLCKTENEWYLEIKTNGEKVKAWRKTPVLTEKLQTHFPSPTIVSVVEAVHLRYNRKEYSIIVEENDIRYGMDVHIDNGYIFEYAIGYYDDFYLEIHEKEEDDPRLAHLCSIFKHVISELPEYRLYVATGMLKFQ